MRVLVFGAGAIGSVVGGFLAKAGHHVTLLGRAWHLDVVRRQGLAITGLWGEHHIPVCEAPERPEGRLPRADRPCLVTATRLEELTRPADVDWIFVCVKAHQTEAVAAMLPALLGPRTLVCSFQNGLGNDQALTHNVEPSRVALARVIFGVELEPGHAHVTVCADDVLLGAPDERFPQERLSALAQILRASGIPARRSDTILLALWAKVLYNCALNGLSALLDVPYGKLLEQPLTRSIMSVIIEEAYQVAVAHRMTLDPPSASAYRKTLFTTLIPKTAGHLASMVQDLRFGKPTEIEALNGALVRMGLQAGVPTPMNALVTRLIHAKEQFLATTAQGMPPL